MRLLSYFLPISPRVLVYMLQQTNYRTLKFIKWILSFPNLTAIIKRQSLVLTSRSKLMLIVAYLCWFLPLFIGSFLGFYKDEYIYLILIIFAPVVTIIGLITISVVLQKLVVTPSYNREINSAKQKINNISAERIAVMGSYGKTTMKELLLTVLSKGKKTSATPGNKNVPASHASWINQNINGSEEVLIFEYGESEPGDIAELADISKPSYAVITGLAPAHLDGYKTMQAIVDDFSSIKNYVNNNQLFVNKQSKELEKAFKDSQLYGSIGLEELSVKDIKIGFEGMDFTLASNKQTYDYHTKLIGRHHIGPLCAVIVLARKIGLSEEQIKQGVAETKPYEHRMQPRQLHGAWLIDDTYNGTIEGMRAGLALLGELPGRRKIYVTPGLVDQGDETQRVHNELGELIAKANPNRVVLMRNSVTDFIMQGMTDFKGELVIEDNPLQFYTNLEHMVAAGDVVLMQNDWPDSYK